MKQIIQATLIVAVGGLFVPTSAHAHGGTYRGPGDTVPPGGGQNGGGGAAGPVGPRGPSTPGNPSGPTTGPGIPGTGRTTDTPIESVTVNRDIGADLTVWPFWWEFNKAAFLNLKSHLYSDAPVSGSDGFFLGRGVRAESRESFAPTEAQIRDIVVPALLRALENETNNDILTGAMIALAKTGDTNAENGRSRLEAAIEPFLADSVQEISETAAIALGILGKASSIDTLEALVNDTPRGRELTKSAEVHYRTRSFAAYALGLLGASPDTLQDERSRIVRILANTLSSDASKQRDVKVACVIALGLAPAEATSDSLPERDKQEAITPDDAGSSRAAQLAFLLEYLDDEANNHLVRAHCPTSLARLVGGMPSTQSEAWREKISKDLVARIGPRSKERNEVVQSAVLALGILGTNGSESASARAALAAAPKDLSDVQAKNFSLIAMAQAGGRPGGDGAGEGILEASRFLTRQFSSGTSSVKPWAGLGMGLLARELRQTEDGHPAIASFGEILRDALVREKNNERLGALAIACGLSGDLEAESLLLDRLERTREETTRGYVALSLGLMNSRESIPTIQEIIRESKYRPELLRQAAVALGVLGDKRIVDDLVEMMRVAKGLGSQAAIASALGFIGDERSVEPLVDMLEDRDGRYTATARGLAAAALGIVIDADALPWNSVISTDLNYRAATETLVGSGVGILDLL